jgi:oligopeptide transport system substrate-binding protein
MRRADVHRKRWSLLLGVLLALLALGTVSCGGGGGGGAGTGTAVSANQVLKMAWGAEPATLDPGLLQDTTSANIVRNIMDPIVILDPKTLDAKPGLAESWDVEGNTVTFHLRQDGKWTNGDPVTAKDFVFSWKRTLSPELAADYSYQLWGIKGAMEYSSCEKNCDALADQVAISAPDDYTLKVELTGPQPWFVAQASHTAFLPVHQATVEKFGDKWFQPQNIVTDGAFKLQSWKHNDEIVLVKNDQWRGAKDVHLTKVIGKIIVDGTTRVQSFQAGEIDALDGAGLPVDQIASLKTTPEFVVYPSLGTYYYGFNIKNISDIHERRALSLAIDRRTITDKIDQTGRVPAEGMTPPGIKGFDQINPKSKWLPADGDLDQAKQEMSQAQNPKTSINLFYNNSAGHKEIATAVQAQWKDLGVDSTLKQQEWAQYLEFLGPPPNQAVDVYRLGWVYDFADAINGLELFTCDSGNNNSNWCSKDFDAVVDKVHTGQYADDNERFALYKQMEEIMFGDDGELPITPIMWYTYPNLERSSIADTFNIDPLDVIDLSKVVFKS